MLNHWSNKHFEFVESALEGVFFANHCRLYQMFEVIELVLDICLVNLVSHHIWSLICYRSLSIYSIHIRFYLFEYNTCFFEKNFNKHPKISSVKMNRSWFELSYQLLRVYDTKYKCMISRAIPIITCDQRLKLRFLLLEIIKNILQFFIFR